MFIYVYVYLYIFLYEKFFPDIIEFIKAPKALI